ncbi:MAG: orotate phosphoribosyltransferase [Phycisphaerae bacterium]|nr:orotate phosphoribosyltransferase [Phycisphaerae bacterium]
MQDYKAEFIEFLVRCGVLTFGDFTTKSGRKTPYFVNTGNYRMGAQLGKLGEFYAQAITDNVGKDFDNLYGPAYKGIPLAVTTSIALSNKFDHDISVTYNRKEAKDHGEGGSLIGHKYKGDEKVVIIEDVVTAGTSVRESMEILAASNKPNVTALVVSVDRMERGTTDLSAIDQIKKDFGINTFAIVTVLEIIEYLHNRPVDGKVLIDDEMKKNMEAYLAQYGAAK